MITQFVDLLFQAQTQFPDDFFYLDKHESWGSQSQDHRIFLRKALYKYLQALQPQKDFESVLDLSTYPKDLDNLFVSISHCKDLGVFVVSSRPIGIDIEMTSRLKKEIVERVSTSDELKLLDDVVLLWPAKEAVFKCDQKAKLISEIKLETWKKSQSKTYEFTSSNRIGWVQSFNSHTIALAIKNS